MQLLPTFLIINNQNSLGLPVACRRCSQCRIDNPVDLLFLNRHMRIVNNREPLPGQIQKSHAIPSPLFLPESQVAFQYQGCGHRIHGILPLLTVVIMGRKNIMRFHSGSA